MRFRVLVLSGVVAGLMAMAAPAHAIDNSLPEVGVSDQKTGPYGAGISRCVDPGESLKVFARVKNVGGGEKSPILLTASSTGAPDLKFKYFKGDKNITAKLTGDGKTVRLAPGDSVRLKVKISVAADAVDASGSTLLTATDVEPPVSDDDVLIKMVCA